MKAIDIQRVVCPRLMNDWKHQLFTTNIAWLYPFECDILSISKSLMSYEFEIKVTRADFFRDFQKSVERYSYKSGGRQNILKHELMQGAASYHGKPRCANRFYFVVPDGMVQPEEVPDHAGLIYVTLGKDYDWISRVKQAPQLHKHKINAEEQIQIIRNTSIKYANLMQKNKR